MKVISAFDAEDVEMSPADVAAKTDLTRASIVRPRLFWTMKSLGCPNAQPFLSGPYGVTWAS